MSTQDASMTEPVEQTHHSESDMITVGDLVVWHQMPFLSVRRLTQLNCPRWSMWDASNIARISKARTLDDTRDWYFPIIVKKEKFMTDNTRPSFRSLSQVLEEVSSSRIKDVWSSWSGIWHSSAQHASVKASPLLPMTHLPHDWLHFSIPREDVIASTGGLLLIKGKSGVVPIRRSKRLNPVLADSNPSSISDTTIMAAGTSYGQKRNRRTPESWKRLLVCNPLTRECRELPAANCQFLGLPSWMVAYEKGVQASLVVNEEANCYRVILTLSHFVAVYTSTTNSWNCLRFPQERPWSQRIPLINYMFLSDWEYISASAHAGGHLYFADVHSTTAANARLQPRKKAINAGTLRLFEVNADAGTWQFVQQYTLRKFHIPSLKYGAAEDCLYDMKIIPFIEILECMESLYAVLPAKVHDAWLIGEEQSCGWKSEGLHSKDEFGRKLVLMPLCFYIMQLQGHAEDCGVLRIQVPLNEIHDESRVLRLMTLLINNRFVDSNWFSCEARGSVIWLACDDYLLSFDVVSRKSQTQIIPLDVVSGKSQTQIIPLDDGTINESFGEERLGFAYRPSLHMKP